MVDKYTQDKINQQHELKARIDSYKRYGLTPTEKLDVVLFIIKFYEISGYGIDALGISRHINPLPVERTKDNPIVLGSTEISKILKMLFDKGLIEINPTSNRYVISFTGDFFLEDGGFVEEKAQKERLYLIQEKQNKNASDLNTMASRGAWWAFVVALCYLLFEMYKFWHDNNCGCIHHH